MTTAKPNILLDIKTSRVSPYLRRPAQVNLTASKSRFPFSLIANTILLLAVAAYALFGFVVAPSRLSSFAAEGQTQEERAQLEKQLADYEQQIADYEATVTAYKKQGATLKGEIGGLTAKIEKLNLQIKVINLSLARLTHEISDNQQQVTVTQQKIDLNKLAIMQALQGVYENEQTSLVTVLLQNPNLSDFFSDINNLLAVQDSLTATVQKINELKNDLLDEQEALVAKKQDAVAYKAFQDQQKQQVVATKTQKDDLLQKTRGSEAKYQELLTQTRESAAKIRNRLFELIGGGEMTFEQAYEFAKFAEQATGVPASLLLAVLDRESRLGKNVGQCSYHDAMAPGPPKSRRDDVTPFLQIMTELGLNAETTKVSCANTDGAYGGGMGSAQFIPTTWLLYRDKIASITGSNPPSPWKNSDAFVGTALYLKDALGACANFSGDAQVRCAAARYYAGANWRNHLFTYGSGTLSRMKQFDDDIAVLNGA